MDVMTTTMEENTDTDEITTTYTTMATMMATGGDGDGDGDGDVVGGAPALLGNTLLQLLCAISFLIGCFYAWLF